MPKRLIRKIEARSEFNTRFTVSNTEQISQGVSLKLTDPGTATAHDGATAGTTSPAAGVANAESKTAATSVGAWRKGVFAGYASGSVTVGDKLVFVADGYLAPVALGTTIASGQIVVGSALADASTDTEFEWVMDI